MIIIKAMQYTIAFAFFNELANLCIGSCCSGCGEFGLDRHVASQFCGYCLWRTHTSAGFFGIHMCRIANIFLVSCNNMIDITVILKKGYTRVFLQSRFWVPPADAMTWTFSDRGTGTIAIMGNRRYLSAIKTLTLQNTEAILMQSVQVIVLSTVWFV